MPTTVPTPTKPDTLPKPAEPAPKPKDKPFKPAWPRTRPVPQPKGEKQH